MSVQRLNWKEKAQLWQMISAVCHADAEGYSIFDRGWNDQRIATAMTEAIDDRLIVNVQVVRQMRHDEIGKYRKVRGGLKRVSTSDFSDMVRRLDGLDEALVERFRMVEERLDQLEAAATTPKTDAPVFTPRGVA